MGNLITNQAINDDVIKMSNGLTSVFIEVICLAGSDIAIVDYQKDLMIWFAQHDSNLLGSGAVGFDIQNMIWYKDIFELQKKFTLEVVDQAMKKKKWNLLPHQPSDIILPKLSEFHQMILAFCEEHIDPNEIEPVSDFDGDVVRYSKCPTHHVYLHWSGCMICGG